MSDILPIYTWHNGSAKITDRLNNINHLIGLVGRVFAIGRETWVQSQVALYQRF